MTQTSKTLGILALLLTLIAAPAKAQFTFDWLEQQDDLTYYYTGSRISYLENRNLYRHYLPQAQNAVGRIRYQLSPLNWGNPASFLRFIRSWLDFEGDADVSYTQENDPISFGLPIPLDTINLGDDGITGTFTYTATNLDAGGSEEDNTIRQTFQISLLPVSQRSPQTPQTPQPPQTPQTPATTPDPDSSPTLLTTLEGIPEFQALPQARQDQLRTAIQALTPAQLNALSSAFREMPEEQQTLDILLNLADEMTANNTPPARSDNDNDNDTTETVAAAALIGGILYAVQRRNPNPTYYAYIHPTTHASWSAGITAKTTPNSNLHLTLTQRNLTQTNPTTTTELRWEYRF